jgi:predicted transcriptional regulator
MKNDDTELKEKLDTIIVLLQHIFALELASRGVRQVEIGKRIHVATATVGKMLKGVKEQS